MKHISLIFAVFFYFLGFTQPLNNADVLYENFEFSDAAMLYEKERSKNTLNNEQLNKLAYCYFVDNNATAGLKLVDSLIRQGNSLTELWYWKAHFQREVKQYDEAVESALKYLELGGENLPLKFRESCYMLQNTPEYIDGSVTEYAENDRKSNMVRFTGNTPVYFYENGLDSLSNDIGLASGSGMKAEVLLMRPYLNQNGKLSEWVVLNEQSKKDLSINSMQYDAIEKKLYFSAAQPASKEELLIASHIYVADCDKEGAPITSFSPWKFSGINDSSSCAHVCLSPDGNMIVFSKLLKGRADADLWYSTRSGADWSIPKLIPGINTLGNELFPSFIGDSLFTFSTDGIIGYGGLDIFSVPFKGEWMDITEKEIKRLPLPLNSVGDDFWLYNLTVDSLVLNSNRTGGKGEDDIYSYRKPIPEVVPEPEPEPVVEITPVKPTFDIDAFLKDCNSKRIYFAFKDGATEEQFDFVDKLKELIDEGYKLRIQITGYADARGTTAVNYEVGMKRANYVKNNLIQKGIPGNILKTVSMGSTKIENKCRTQWIQCTEEEHRQNRYVQLTISKAD